MKPELLKITAAASTSFNIRQDVGPYFYNRWHYHPEIEMVLIEKGKGTQFIGDSVAQFGEGDILLIGSNLPHFWRCNDDYFANAGLLAEATVIHFEAEFWGKKFLHLLENKHIHRLLLTAGRGLQAGESIRMKIAVLMNEIRLAKETDRIILLLTILNMWATAPDNMILSSVDFKAFQDRSESDRINDIYTYSMSRFREKISLEQIAAVANVTPQSFCRYFKNTTQKNYSRFLQEIRIRYACKLLVENKLSITEICYESGFNNFVNFYRCFRIITGKTPHRYQRDNQTARPF